MALYLFDMLYNVDSLFSIFFVAVVIWLAMKYVFGVQSFWNALILAFVGMIFLPLIAGAAQTMFASLILLAVGALLVQQLYAGSSLTSSVVAMAVALIISFVVFPSIY
ncbi:MAG: hypothetical protein V1787_05180 [Candidatus Micrarchaeota archaeon]